MTENNFITYMVDCVGMTEQEAIELYVDTHHGQNLKPEINTRILALQS
jgi:hypothetical protein